MTTDLSRRSLLKFSAAALGAATVATAASELVVPGAATAAVPRPATIPQLTWQRTPKVWGDQMGIAAPAYDFSRFSGAELNRRLDLLAGTGVTWARTDLWLEGLIQVKGKAPAWETVDPYIYAMVARGITPVLVAHTMPVWARTGGSAVRGTTGPATAAQRTVYAEFMKQAVLHYKGIVKHWEVWNEPNLHQFWGTPDINAYGALLKESYQAIKAADPSAVVITGGTGGAAPGTSDIDALVWVRELYTRGFFDRYSSRVAIHAYTDSANGNLGEFYRLDAYRKIMDAHGDGAKNLWITEGGSHVLDGHPRATEAQQAALYPKVAEQWMKLHHRGPLFWFSLFNNGNTPYTNDSTGLIRDDNRTLRPAYRTLAGLSRRTYTV